MYDVATKTADDLHLAALNHSGDYAQINAAFQKLGTILGSGGHWPQTRGMAGQGCITTIRRPPKLKMCAATLARSGLAAMCRVVWKVSSWTVGSTRYCTWKVRILASPPRTNTFTGHGSLKRRPRCALI